MTFNPSLYIGRIYTPYIVQISFDCFDISIKLRIGKIWSICDNDMVFFDKIENIRLQKKYVVTFL